MATYTQSRYQTDAYGRPVSNPEYPVGTLQPQYSPLPVKPYPQPGTGAMNGTDHFMSPSSARAPRSTGNKVPPIPPTTSKYFPGDSPKSHPKIGTPSPPPAPGPLPWEPTTPTLPPLPLPGTTHSDTHALWHLRRHAPPPSLLARWQRVAKYIQRRNSALQGLRMYSEEFVRRTRTLLASLGQKHPDGTPEDWAHRLLDLNEKGIAGQLPEAVCEDLQQNAFKRNELHYLVDEIHTSPNPGAFTSPVDPTRSFHVQRGAPFNPNDTRLPEQRNQAELNAAFATLHALNPNGGLFEQPAARTIGLSARQTWGQTIRKKITAVPQRDDDARSDGTLCYVDNPALPQLEPASFHRKRPPHVDLQRTRGRDTPPPPELCPLNPGPQRAPPGPPPQASPTGPPRRPPGPPGPALPLHDQGMPQPPSGPPHPPGQPPAPPSDPDNPGGPPPPLQWNPGPPPGDAGLLGGGPPGGRPPRGWGPALGTFPPPQGGNHYYYYYNAGPPLRNPGPQDDECDALAQEGKLDIQKPESFTGRDPRR
ncbi:hypothetical protein C0992_006842, partial [Termitomyces sp. T32_za158]